MFCSQREKAIFIMEANLNLLQMAYYANAMPVFCGNILYSFSCVDVSSRNIKCKTGDLSFDFLARYSRLLDFVLHYVSPIFLRGIKVEFCINWQIMFCNFYRWKSMFKIYLLIFKERFSFRNCCEDISKQKRCFYPQTFEYILTPRTNKICARRSPGTKYWLKLTWN